MTPPPPAPTPPVPPTTLRFAVLHHEGTPEPHYDLLIETYPNHPLATWRCPCWPIQAPTPLQRQPDHRRIYLTYQGPLSARRGHVTQIAAGECRIIEQTADHLIADLYSADATSRITLHRLQSDQWQATCDRP